VTKSRKAGTKGKRQKSILIPSWEGKGVGFRELKNVEEVEKSRSVEERNAA
jgi:hypothetical protein